MKNYFNQLSTKLSITRGEIYIITVLLGSALIGLAFKTFLPYNEALGLIEQKEKEFFTGSEVDSILTAEEKFYQKYVDLTFSKELTGDISGGNPEQKSSEKLNFNQATYQELLKLPGIGPVMAERLIRFRTYKGGKLTNLRDLLEVKGISHIRLNKLKDHLNIE
jgi:competence protein ComEA